MLFNSSAGINDAAQRERCGLIHRAADVIHWSAMRGPTSVRLSVLSGAREQNFAAQTADR